MPSFAERLIWFRALDYLRQYRPLVISVGGNTNTTVTKQLVALALTPSMSVYAPPEPYSHPLGVALSILGQSPTTRINWMSLLSRSFVRELREHEPNAIVLELGANRPGEMDWMAQQLPTDVAILTGIGNVRTDLFGDLPTLAHEYSSLPVTLSSQSTAIINLDDPLTEAMVTRTTAHVVTVGSDPRSQFRLVRIHRLGSRGFSGEIATPKGRIEIHLPYIIARHQLVSVLAALAVAFTQGITTKEAVNRIQKYRPPAGHHALIPGIRQSLVIDDSYDASPETMLSSLEALRAIPGDRRIAVLGHIPGLGNESQGVHRLLGEAAAKSSEIFISVGDAMRPAQAVAMKKGIDTHHFATSSEAGKWLPGYVRSGDVVLISGSQELDLKRIASRLTIIDE